MFKKKNETYSRNWMIPRQFIKYNIEEGATLKSAAIYSEDMFSFFLISKKHIIDNDKSKPFVLVNFPTKIQYQTPIYNIVDGHKAVYSGEWSKKDHAWKTFDKLTSIYAEIARLIKIKILDGNKLKKSKKAIKEIIETIKLMKTKNPVDDLDFSKVNVSVIKPNTDPEYNIDWDAPLKPDS